MQNEYENRLISVIRSDVIELREAEPWLDAAIGLCALCGFRVFIYGAGKDVDIFIKYLNIAGVIPEGIIDKNPDRRGEFIEGVKIISPEAFLDDESVVNKREKLYVFVYTLIEHGSRDEKNITGLMNRAGVLDYYLVGDCRYSVAGLDKGFIPIDEGRRAYYKSHEKELLRTLALFNDTKSKETFIEYIRAYIECSYYKFDPLPTRYKYFKDEDGKDMFKPLTDEVWVNCGADEGSTIMNYFLCGYRAKKIYSVESNPDLVSELEDHMQHYPDGLKDMVQPVQLYIIPRNKELIDDMIPKDPKISLINADIEGGELTMLQGLEERIQNDRPVIALCVYHKKEDLIDIPNYICSITTDYCFMLRKYACWLKTSSARVYELVLYAIPKERMNTNE